jgi:hypothetical protein
MVREVTPFTKTNMTVRSSRVVDEGAAKEVTPIMLFGKLPGVVSPVPSVIADLRPAGPNNTGDAQKTEAKAANENAAGDDPKVVTLSATDNAQDSGTGTGENGTPATKTQKKIHPSTLSEKPVDPATVGKDPSLPLLPS